MFKIFSFVIQVALCFQNIESHAFLKYPISRRSKYSDYYLQNNLVDYNLYEPLDNIKYKFPCKNLSVGPTITEIKSNNIQISIELGSSPNSEHNGGHCQFGFSYDNKNFVVLKHIINDCLKSNLVYDMIIPSNIPDGNIIFFWTWINSVGNREYYMDCADIKLNRGITLTNNYYISGKNIVVVNLIGYPTIPEFPNLNDYDGRELLRNSNNILLQIPSTKQITTIPSTKHITTIPSTKQITTVPSTKQITTISSTKQITTIPSTTPNLRPTCGLNAFICTTSNKNQPLIENCLTQNKYKCCCNWNKIPSNNCSCI